MFIQQWFQVIAILFHPLNLDKMDDSLHIFMVINWRGSKIPWSFKCNHIYTILKWFALLNNCWNRRNSWIFLISDNRSGQRTVLCTALSPTEVKNRCTRTGQIYSASFTENFLGFAAVGLYKSEVVSKNSWWVSFSRFAHTELRIHQNLFTLILVQIWMCTSPVNGKFMQWSQNTVNFTMGKIFNTSEAPCHNPRKLRYK